MKNFILTLIAGIFIAFVPAHAQQGHINDPEIKKAEAYLQNLTTARADFIQTSSLGSRLSGKFYLNRPGKLRFDYNEVDDFIVADGVFIYFYDSQMGSQTNAPIGSTLADFLLRKNLSLSGDLNVVQLFKQNDHISITLVQKDDAAAGSVELIFSEIPYQLVRWRVTDAQGQRTEIVLKNMETGIKLSNNLFGYQDPKGRKQFNN